MSTLARNSLPVRNLTLTRGEVGRRMMVKDAAGRRVLKSYLRQIRSERNVLMHDAALNALVIRSIYQWLWLVALTPSNCAFSVDSLGEECSWRNGSWVGPAGCDGVDYNVPATSSVEVGCCVAYERGIFRAWIELCTLSWPNWPSACTRCCGIWKKSAQIREKVRDGGC
jgi:hypothetical protein